LLNGVDGLPKRKALFVQCAPNYGPYDVPFARRCGQLLQMHQGADASACDYWKAALATEPGSFDDIGTHLGAIPVYVRIQHGRQCQVRSSSHDINGKLLGLLVPAMRCNSTLPPVDGQNDSPSEFLSRQIEKFRIG
jgi:hypothetical protein